MQRSENIKNLNETGRSNSRQRVKVAGSSEKKRKRQSLSSISDDSESGQYVRQSPVKVVPYLF